MSGGVQFKYMTERQQRDWALARIDELEAIIGQMRAERKRELRLTRRVEAGTDQWRLIYAVQFWLKSLAKGPHIERTSPAVAAITIALWRARGVFMDALALEGNLPTVKGGRRKPKSYAKLVEVYIAIIRHCVGYDQIATAKGPGYRLSDKLIADMDARFGANYEAGLNSSDACEESDPSVADKPRHLPINGAEKAGGAA